MNRLLGGHSALRAWTGAGLGPNVRRLGLVSFLQDVASEMVYPLLPAFLVALGGGPLSLAAMESAGEAVLALVKRQAGRASDRCGRRRPFVAAGYGLSAALRPLLALAGQAWQVVALRAADRFAKGIRAAPRDALLAESARESDLAWAFSFHRGLDHLGAALGPLVAALLLAAAPGNLRLVFLAATLPALLAWATARWGVTEPRRDLQPPAGPARPRPEAPAGPSAGALGPLLAAFLLFALAHASGAFLLLRAGELGMGLTSLPLVWAALNLLHWLFSAPAGRLADRLGHRRAVVAGWLLYALAAAGFATASTPAALVALLVPYALSHALSEGPERALAAGARSAAGTGGRLGAFHLWTGLGSVASNLLFGALWSEASPRAAFSVSALLALAATAALAAGRNQR